MPSHLSACLLEAALSQAYSEVTIGLSTRCLRRACARFSIVTPLALAVLLAMPLAASAEPEPDAVAEILNSLGDYERETVLGALKERHLSIEEAPDGKLLSKIIIVNRPVFDDSTGWFQALNFIHITTRDQTIRDSLLARPGDSWSDALARETERVLRNPSLSSFVVALPVTSIAAGKVDMLVVTRDIWSLKPNTEIIHEDGSLTYLNVAAAENNILGRRKHGSFIFEMDQGEYSLSTRWRDLSVLGSRWQYVEHASLIYERGTNDFEGTETFTSVTYPLWSLASKWGGSIVATHKDAVTRNFEGAELATFDDPSTPEIEALPQEFSLFEVDVRSQVQRSIGRRVKQQFSLGHELLVTRPEFFEDNVPLANQSSFAADLFPRSERSSAIALGYDLFEARYITYRNINGYDLPEVKIAGLNVNAEAALALRLLGSETTFARTKLRASYHLPITQDGFVETGLTLSRRIEGIFGGTLNSVDTTFGADVFGASPTIGPVRLVAFGEASLRQDVRDNKLVRLGGQSNLRGFEIGSFVGTSFYSGTVELRSLPHKLFFMRVGYVAFYDIGDAALAAKSLGIHQDVGLGFKGLIPQTGEALFFAYWAVPLDRGADKFPGRLSFGFGHEL